MKDSQHEFNVARDNVKYIKANNERFSTVKIVGDVFN